jgi:hypothetical protein
VFSGIITSHTNESYFHDRSNICTVGAPFLAVANGQKVYWELTILEAQGSVRLGFAGTKISSGSMSKILGQGKKSWGLSSDNCNGYHRYSSLVHHTR